MMAKALEKNTKEKSKFQFSELTRIPYQSTLENMISNFQMALDQYLSNSYLWTLLYGHILRDSAFLVGSWTVVLEKTLESPLGCKEIQPVHPKGDQSWVFTGRTDVETEAPILWPPEAKNWLIGKDHDARWGRLKVGEEGDKRGWDGWMASPTPWTWVWVGSGSWWWTGGLACCSPWGYKELDTTEQLSWTELKN